MRSLATPYAAHRRLQHVEATPRDFAQLRAAYDMLLCVTSTSPMSCRLQPMAKYNTVYGHGNTTMRADVVTAQFAKMMSKLRAPKRLYERYPYNAEITEVARILPHYVFCQETFDHDLRTLLRALGCAYVSIVTQNLYAIDGAADDLIRTNDFSMGDFRYDFRYAQLIQLGGTANKRGLEMAKTF